MEGFRATLTSPINYAPLNNPENHLQMLSSTRLHFFLNWHRFLGLLGVKMVLKICPCDEGGIELLEASDWTRGLMALNPSLNLTWGSTPIETNKALLKDEEAEDVDVHLYRSMIGSLMYLTASRPDIMFAVCACARDSPFDLEAFSDSDYAGASLDRKSTTGGCQFLGKRLISWQCKKQTIVANSTTEAEYVAAANCCGQVLWIQNQMLDYGFNFMNTKIHIDNESTIYETVYKEWADGMERAASTASSLEAELDSGKWS
ncbi:hypothetical protein Tco_0890929 [Tanacetum coccineum]|uniref:Uncharacterized protein n=1 Tax=Tanacetum coccineum TaxID=301880 RepID=A0ABQ5C3N2_9ASTR